MSMIAIASLESLLLSCLHVRLQNALLNITKYMSSTGIILKLNETYLKSMFDWNPISSQSGTKELHEKHAHAHAHAI